MEINCQRNRRKLPGANVMDTKRPTLGAKKQKKIPEMLLKVILNVSRENKTKQNPSRLQWNKNPGVSDFSEDNEAILPKL